MNLRIDLLRHGETTLSHTLRGSTDDELTELGWQQMRQTIQQHQEKQKDQSSLQQSTQTYAQNWDVIYCSNLQRCEKFAEQLAGELALLWIEDSRLQEMHFGDWEGISTQQIYDEQPELLANFWQFPTQFTPPNAEKLLDFQQRIVEAFSQLKMNMLQSQQQSALVVTHGGVIKLLKCISLNRPLDDILKMSAELGQLNSFNLLIDSVSNDFQIELLEVNI